MKRIVLAATLAAGAISLTGCGSKTETPAAPEGAAAENVTAPSAPVTEVSAGQMFANSAAASDAFEIATSNLALQLSQSAAVKRFAEQMITAHGESTAKLKAAAAAAAAGATPALTPDPTLTPVQQGKLDTLQGKGSSDFDAAYAAEQIAAHQTTLEALRSYAANADIPQLGEFATKMIPTVAAHLNMAKSLKP